ncbi:MAG TPA: SRPBCC family protein [Solirubrobacteraceae bacterium]|nr:SRPBCC family protein [Solirubrobacteraceae bacterium]
MIEVAGTTRAPAARIWAVYEDTATAPDWDPLVGEIRPDGPLELGRTAHNKPRRGPAMPSTITELTAGTSYTESIRVPGAILHWSHTLTAGPDGVTAIRHGVRCEGALAGVYALLYQRSFHRGMRVALDNLIARVETT